MPGSIAANPHQGTRSEYLALYALSAIGTAVSVPHPEDSGIDLYCTLGRNVGKLFTVEHYFLVQVKSSAADLVFSGEMEITWLLSHNYPFLLCIVDKITSRIFFYQTLEIAFLHAKIGIETITLRPNSNEKQFDSHTNEFNPIISLGKPILAFEIQSLSDSAWIKNARATLKSWITLDQINIFRKNTGLTMFGHPNAYKTNFPIDKPNSYTGNFLDTAKNLTKLKTSLSVTFELLAQLTHQAAANKDANRVKKLGETAITLFDGQVGNKGNDALKLFIFAYNTACHRLKLNEVITLSLEDGEYCLLKSQLRNK